MKRLLQNRTVKFKIMVYNICIICVIGIIFSVTSYVTANKKAVQLAQNSVEYHVESISRYYQEVYEQMDRYTAAPHVAAVSLRPGSEGYEFWRGDFVQNVRRLLAQQ